jgi:hypothetical protein
MILPSSICTTVVVQVTIKIWGNSGGGALAVDFLAKVSETKLGTIAKTTNTPRAIGIILFVFPD